MERGTYYLYGTTDKNCWTGPFVGFDVYQSSDLEEWVGPHPAFRPSEDFWADQNFWAPEVFRYGDRYYMFASFKKEGVARGTQILAAAHPHGPFVPHSSGPVTPRDWECLDGTLFVDDDNTPWMVFCHEWVQVSDGEILAVPLNPELTSAVDQPQLLFRASEAPWSRPIVRNGKKHFVTDGPFLWKTKNGELVMLWSSMGTQGYAMGIARSTTGSILGPWVQDPKPIYEQDGGHGMMFRTFDGRLILTFHTPNNTPDERPIFLELNEDLSVKV